MFENKSNPPLQWQGRRFRDVRDIKKISGASIDSQSQSQVPFPPLPKSPPSLSPPPPVLLGPAALKCVFCGQANDPGSYCFSGHPACNQCLEKFENLGMYKPHCSICFRLG